MSGTVTGSDQVRGDLLSCYSTAVAGVMRRVGLPYLALMGGQLFLGARRRGEILEFLHLHTPLVGDALTFSLPLLRRGAADPATAGRAIAEQAAERGVVVVTGATASLPWIAAEDVEPAPHWFLVTPRSGADPRSGSGLTLSDVFTWVDDAGEHPGLESDTDQCSVGGFSWSPRPSSTHAHSRERWCLGVARERPDWDAERPWQWLEVGPVAPPDAPGAAAFVPMMAQMLERTVAGRIVDPQVAGEGWAVGADAFEMIAAELDRGRADPAAYRMHNDLWVAARARQLFAVALRSAAANGMGPKLADVADKIDTEMVPRWSALIRLLRYNAIRVARGSAPRSEVGAHLVRLSEIEHEVIDQVAAGLVVPGAVTTR